MNKPAVTALLLASLLLFTSCKMPARAAQETFDFGDESRVLDGDTILFKGQVFKIAEIDAPELGPWAKCWAEAALAGQAKAYVETNLSSGGWRIIANKSGAGVSRTARVVRADGEDLGDLMVVYGYAAKTSGRWDWCGVNANLHSPNENEAKPHGPSLWWPTGPMYDPRAAD